MKTNVELVNYCKAQLGLPYWFGTFGQIASVSLLNNKAKQYPKYYSAARIAKAKKEHIGKRVHDCMGLVKGFLWDGKYKASEDWSADSTFEKADVKGTIDTIPEIVGVCVRYKGHVGVYVGNGEVIEARGFDYGVVKTKLSGRKWSHWYKHPLIKYVDTNVADNDTKVDAVNTYTVKKGDTLSKIAKKFGVSVEAIAKRNNIENVNVIHVGQVLYIDGDECIDARKYVYVNVNTVLNCRNAASMSGKVICTFKNNTKLELIENLGDWCKVKHENVVGYCSSKYLKF